MQPRPHERERVTQFIHLWRNKNGAWKITRVISFDHQALNR